MTDWSRTSPNAQERWYIPCCLLHGGLRLRSVPLLAIVVAMAVVLQPAGGYPLVIAERLPTGELIAYISTGGSAPGLYVVKTDGTANQLLVAGEELGDPRWSPDGTLIAFLDRGDPQNALKVIKLGDLSVQTLLPCPLSASGRYFGYHFSGTHFWSPDSTKIVVDHCLGGLVVLDVATGQTTIIGTDTSPAVYGSWNPQNDEIIFYCGGTSVCTADSDGNNRQEIPLSGSSSGVATVPKWSPDATHILAVRPFVGDWVRVYEADGSNQNRLWGSTSYPVIWSIPAWSPSGARVAFARGVNGPCGTTQIVDSTTGDLTTYPPRPPLRIPARGRLPALHAQLA